MKILYTFILIASTILSAKAQANWSAVLPTKFPTNASGQIHGISRVSQMKWHPTNPNKMYAVSARGGLFISQDAGCELGSNSGNGFHALLETGFGVY
ncbi:MAG: hypothetical protein IPG90_04270 [Bacteroidetes bacterium]|nr:hypothetical protein [Bacteroidota bacterium]